MIGNFNLFTESAASAFVQFAAEALLNEVVEAVAEGFEFHLVNDLVDKGVLQEESGLFEGDASLAHVEQGRIVELSNGRSMGALHIVGIDLKHRLGVHMGLLGGSEVLVGHL